MLCAVSHAVHTWDWQKAYDAGVTVIVATDDDGHIGAITPRPGLIRMSLVDLDSVLPTDVAEVDNTGRCRGHVAGAQWE